MKKVLIGGPIYQKPVVLQMYLQSLMRLKTDGLAVDFLFLDDNENEVSRNLLENLAKQHENITVTFGGEESGLYICDDSGHHWTQQLMFKLANYRNYFLRKAAEGGYDYLFLVDSDLMLHPQLLQHLIRADKSILSEIFWTKWTPEGERLPNVWMRDQYSLAPVVPGEYLTPEEAFLRGRRFIESLRTPGIYEVGGLGACTLIRRDAFTSGIHFGPIHNISLQGEDRYFCVRAVAYGFSLYVDTAYPAYHIYRESDIPGAAIYLQETSIGAHGG